MPICPRIRGFRSTIVNQQSPTNQQSSIGRRSLEITGQATAPDQPLARFQWRSTIRAALPDDVQRALAV
jgi:hypothetical protein